MKDTSKTYKAISEGRLTEALEQLATQARALGDAATTRDIHTMQETYGYLLQYLADGTDDPSRADMHASLLDKAWRLSEKLRRRQALQDDSTEYASWVRIQTHMGTEQTFPLDTHGLFMRIVTAFPLKHEDITTIQAVLEGDDRERAVLAVSALYLGLMEFYDEERLRLLADTYSSATDEGLQIRALVGLVLALLRYSDMTLGKDIDARIEALPDLVSSWNADVRMVTASLLRTIDTERISHRMTHVIFPDLMSLRPDILERLNASTEEDDILGGGSDMNPEWEDILAQSKVADHLKELNDLQMEGSDVMMAAFAQLKTFSFFAQIERWLTPFTAARARKELEGAAVPDTFLDIVEQIPNICDGDKYSMAFSFQRVPRQQAEMMMGQLREHGAELREAFAAAASGGRAALADNYLHDLYRLYHLYPRHGEWYNPFRHSVDVWNVSLLRPSVDHLDSLHALSSLALRLEQWQIALDYLRRQEKISMPTASIYQQLGLCFQKLGQTETAMEAYRQADFVQADNIWTLQRLGATQRMIGALPEALRTYQRLERLMPQDVGVAIKAGNVLLTMERYDQAVKEYYKAEFLDEQGTRHLRPLAWCLMLQGHPDKARRYHDLILADNPRPSDYLNAGHNALVAGDIKRALSHYRHYKADDTVQEAFRKDEPYLRKAGVEPLTILLVHDILARAE